jgi:diguanylate cyclase (GGDEF)-like protein
MITPLMDSRLQLFRREAFDRDLADGAASALQTGEPLALIMIDLDRFKSINDQHGHPVGDEVLESVAGWVRQVVGAKGVSYRYGGEELCVLLVNYTADEGAALAERIRRQIEQAPLSSKQLQVTASFGVAELPGQARTATELVEKADQALYQAKNLGRNLVRISGEPPPTLPGPKPTTRRQPEPGGLSDKQAETIRQDYFRRGSAECPHDRARLTVNSVHMFGRRTPSLSVLCPLCGLNAHLDGLS